MRTLIYLKVTFVVVALTACEEPDEENPLPSSRSITILWSGTLIGELHECDCPIVPGGLPRLATLVAEQRSTITDLGFLIEVGDVAGDPSDDEEVSVDPELARRVRAELAFEALGSIGYDIYVPGERDLTLGARPYAEQIAANDGVLLTSNVSSVNDDSMLGESVYWVETELGDVALLSLLQELDEEQLAAANRGHDPPIDVLDTALTLQTTLEVVLERAAFVVLFAHGTKDWARGLFEEVEGVDVAIIAHEYEDPRTVESVGNTILLYTASEAKSLGRLEIILHDDETITFGGSPWPPDNNYDQDPEILAIIDELNNRLEQAQEDLETANEGELHPSGGSYRGFSFCGTCHTDQINVWYTTPHAEAFQALQAINWYIEPACFECHTSGFGFETGFVSRASTPTLSGVTCEACHGPSLNEDDSTPCPSGYGAVDESTCLACHRPDRDPEFNFAEDLLQIEHSP